MKILFFIFGILLILAAIFAKQIGIDNDSGWGAGRVLILEAGGLLVFVGVVIHLFEGWARRVAGNFTALVHDTISRPVRIAIASLMAAVLVLTSYVWFIQLNQRSAAREYDYYIELAKGFKDGNLYLADTPSAALLALNNPYDYFQRREMNVDDFPWDVSLYKNRFYIYWGPVPALLVSILSRDQLSRTGDFHLALVFACGLFIYSALLIANFWHRSLQNTPAWLLGLLLTVVGISAPLTIMLKGAKVYEAAIFGCQFFLVGGCFWAYSSFYGDKPVIWKLALASAHWALAAGTRIIVLPAVLFCAFFTVVYIVKVFKIDAANMRLTLFAAGTVPLAFAGLGLAWYNWARYDSIFEFGLTYQLANIDYTNFQNVFTLQRIPQNLSLYFFHPLKVVSRFPYLSRIEYLPSNDRLAGLIYIAPYVFLLPLISLFRWINHLWLSKGVFSKDADELPSETWLFFTLTGSGLLSLAIILSYYFVAMRFMADFMPMLMILTTIHIGRESNRLKKKPALTKILMITAASLAMVTITANILLAIPGSGTSFMVNQLNTFSKFLGLK